MSSTLSRVRSPSADSISVTTWARYWPVPKRTGFITWGNTTMGNPSTCSTTTRPWRWRWNARKRRCSNALQTRPTEGPMTPSISVDPSALALSSTMR